MDYILDLLLFATHRASTLTIFASIHSVFSFCFALPILIIFYVPTPSFFHFQSLLQVALFSFTNISKNFQQAHCNF